MKRRHEDLLAWQEAIDFVTFIYQVTKQFPKQETYGITSQIRRAAISVPSNIAEGASRLGHKEFLQFLAIARSSLVELETQVTISKNLGYTDDKVFNLVMIKTNKVFSLISGLINSIHRRRGETGEVRREK